ncbi:MAG: hypothetical protein WBQ69_10455 [Gallionella sp.]
MEKFVKSDHNWEHLYTQYKNATKGRVVCMVHRETKKFAYFDVQLNRFLSKNEALIYRVDVTGKYLAHP